jgi:capsular polysaccharide biosynthesis protein
MSVNPGGARKRRHKILVGVFVLLGIGAGLGFAVLTPPTLTSTASVYLPSTVHDISTQVVIATSDPVLVGALRTIDSGESPRTLRSAIQVKNVTTNMIAFSARGKTAAQAERTADAVATSYAAYVNAPSRPGPPVQAQILTSAKAQGASGPAKVKHWVTYSGLGALAGLLLGSIVALVVSALPRN